MPTDPLVRYLEKRNRRTFKALVHATRDRVLCAAHRVLGDRALAEDVTQEVFVKLLTVTWRPDEVRCGIALLTTTAVNLARTRLRSESRRADRERGAAAREGAGPDTDEPDLEAVRLAVAELPDDLRGCVELRYFGGLALTDVATQLGWPLRTTSHRLKRAREVLRERLAPAQYAGVLAFVEGLTEEAPGAIEPSASLLDQLGRLARDGVACADIAARSPSGVRRLLVAAAAAAALVAATWLVGNVAADGPAGDDPWGGSDAETADGDPAPVPPPRPLPSRKRRPGRTDGDTSGSDTAPSTTATAATSTDADTDTLSLEVEVVDELGNRLTDGMLDLGLRGFPGRAQMALLAPFRSLSQPQSLADANPLIVTGMPRELAGLELDAQATLHGLPPSERARFELLADAPQRVRLMVTRPRDLEVRVIDRLSGEPVRGAHVLSMSELDRRDIDEDRAAGHEGPGSAVTRGDGTCVLTGLGGGTHEIEVLRRGYLPGRLAQVALDAPCTLRLEPAPPEATLTTRVRDPDGAPVAGMRVLLHLQQSDTKRVVRSNSRGECVFDAVPPGMHRVEVDVADWSLRSRDEDWPRDGDIAHTAFPRPEPGERLSIDLGFLSGAGRIVVELFDASGKPARGVDVRLTGKSRRAAKTDAGGRATFERLPAGEYGCEWDRGVEWSAAERLNVTDDEPVRVRHVLGGETLRGRVVTAESGKPVRGANVLALGPAVAWATTDADGRFELPGAAHGKYSITALARGRAAGESALELRAGEPTDDVTVKLARGGRVRIHLPDELDAPWFEVVLVREAGGSFDTSPDESGDADRITPRVAPGDYIAELRIPGRKSLRAPVQVEDGKDSRVRFETE